MPRTASITCWFSSVADGRMSYLYSHGRLSVSGTSRLFIPVDTFKDKEIQHVAPNE